MQDEIAVNGVGYIRSDALPARFVQVTPEQAAEWLEKNTRNRKYRKWYSIALSEAMKRGEWITTHQGVAFSKSGILLDGQHRLRAIVLSGLTIAMLVVTGIDDKAFQVIDRGMGRTYTDVTGLPKKTAELAAAGARYLFRTTKPSPQQVLQVANAGLSEIQEKIEAYTKSNVKFLTAAPMRLAVAYMLLKGYDEHFVLSQYKALAHRAYSELTETSASFLRRVDAGEMYIHDTDDVITRAVRCFNPKETNLKKIYAGDDQKTEMREALRGILGEIIDRG